MRHAITGVFTAVAMTWAATVALAITPAEKCEADKLKRAGKYSFCRLKAESKAIKTNSAPDYSLCDLKLSQKWTDAETVGGGMCPTNGDLGTMQARITGDANDVAACLNGACPPPSCGNGVVGNNESCDGIDLGGATCASLGYALGGTLGCTAGCDYDTSGCQGQSVPATGQTTSYGPGSDGDIQAGAALAYTDNGDGTVTDNNTRLMWEKKSDDGSIHDWDDTYTWRMTGPPYTMNGTIVTVFLDTLNDVAGGGASCFAGHCDWRIPNIKELHSIVNYEILFPAATVDPVFDTACAPTCTVLTCSCTHSDIYWSSTTYQDGPGFAGGVYFYGGFMNSFNKSFAMYVRAVRGGL